MYCHRHPDHKAVGACVECSRMVCPECKVEFDGRIYCNSCIERKIAGGAFPGSASPAIGALDNTSGMGGQAAVPPGLGEWNWGGFLLTFIWGIGNNVWWSFLVFVPYFGPLVMPFVLAFKGNEWAWQSKRWDSVEHFKSVQHTWAVWGWGLSIAITSVIVIIMIAATVLLLWWLQKGGVKF
jgi:hypothetical protein